MEDNTMNNDGVTNYDADEEAAVERMCERQENLAEAFEGNEHTYLFVSFVFPEDAGAPFKDATAAAPLKVVLLMGIAQTVHSAGENLAAELGVDEADFPEETTVHVRWGSDADIEAMQIRERGESNATVDDFLAMLQGLRDKAEEN